MKQYLNEFPTTQAEMAEWQSKYKFDTGAGKWYDPAAQAQQAEQSGYSEIEQSIQDIQSKIPSLSADIKSLGSKTSIDTSLAPSLDTNAGDMTATGNGLSAQFTAQLKDSQSAYERLIKQQEERMKKAGEKKQTYLDKLTGLVEKKEKMGTLDTEALYKKTLTEYGLTPEKVQEVQGLVGQITTYCNQIVNLEDRKQAAIERIEGRPGIDIGFMNREQTEVSRKYNREISTKAAQAGVLNQQIQLQRGLFSDARATAGQIVNAATYDQQQKVADMDWAIDTYADLFNTMDKEERNAWNTAYSLQKEELDRQQTDMTNKLNMLVDAGENGVSLKWDMNYMKDKTLEELTMEYSNKMAGRPAGTKGYAPTSSMKEYNLAVSQGYEGSFAEFSGKGGGISNEDLADFITAFFYGDTPITSREQAVREINEHATSIMLRLGKTGYDVLVAKMNDKFPQLPEAPKVKPKTAEEIGKEAGGFAKKLPAVYARAARKPLEWAEKGGEAVGGFFKELFGF